MPDFATRLRELMEKATPGPWKAMRYAFGDWLWVLYGYANKMIAHNSDDHGEDLELAALLRNHAAAILALVSKAKSVTDASLMGDLGLADLTALREALKALDEGE